MSQPRTEIRGLCPACNRAGLYVGEGGYITCSASDCPASDLAADLIAEIGQARRHAAYSFCGQNVGHVPMHQFAKKINEKLLAERRAERLTADIDRVRDLHAPVQHMGQTWCRECSVRRSTGPKTEEWVAYIPHPCPTLDALEKTEPRP